MIRRLLAGVLLSLAAVFAFPTVANAVAGDDGAEGAASGALTAGGPMLAVWAAAGAIVLAVAFVSVMITVRRSRRPA